MNTYEAIVRRRTVRLFEQKPVPYEMLERCVDAGRLAPSARNLQVLEYVVVDSDGPLDAMFRCMGFGGGLDKGELKVKGPMAYVVILINKDIPSNWAKHDSAMAAQNVMLTACEQGLGSCVLAKINRKAIMELLEVPDRYETDLVVALGYPAEEPVVEPAGQGKTGYYRDREGRLHIPKRRLADVMHRNVFK